MKGMNLDWAAQQLNETSSEATSVDKLLDRGKYERLRQLMRIEVLSRKQLLEIMYLLSEEKLVSFDYYDRYLIGKFFVWVREFAVIGEKYFDIQERESKILNELKKDNSKKEEIKNQEEILNKINGNLLSIQHTFKFLVDVFLYLVSSTLSLDAVAFENFTKHRIEEIGSERLRPPPEKTGFWSKIGGHK